MASLATLGAFWIFDFRWYHLIMLIALIGLIIFWFIYRRRQL